ncbi:Hydrophobin [Penicillium taxi]|uniref:Hydrophobin n=1 Tax=Penicillium taxi TaxID=168475 RepID=UPI002544F873|nr:Hydrophobin [Penicillium taxi]KAJ5893218.1 Hydrophobin [Penicillium taxi]
MQFSITAIILAISTLTVALPAESSLMEQGDDVKWKVPKGLTVTEAQAKCGDQAQLSCCNKATYAGDTTNVNSGLGGGLLSHLIGTGSGAEGLGLFEQCSKLDAQLPIIGIRIQDLLDQNCKQNVACCANSPSTAGKDLIGAGLPCVALGSIL